MHPTPTAQAPYQQPLQTNQTTFTYSSQPRTLLVTTGDGSVKLLDYPSLTTVHALHAHTSACFCLELSPTGRYLAVGGSDALISLWDTTEWVCRRTLAGMVGAVKQVSFSWDGSYVVGGSDEGNGLEIVSFFFFFLFSLVVGCYVFLHGVFPASFTSSMLSQHIETKFLETIGASQV